MISIEQKNTAWCMSGQVDNLHFSAIKGEQLPIFNRRIIKAFNFRLTQIVSVFIGVHKDLVKKMTATDVIMIGMSQK